jgi:esterase/lipase
MNENLQPHVPVMPIILVIVGTIIIILTTIWVSGVAGEYNNLKESPCESIIINNKFSDIRGGYTTYYIVDNSNISYVMYLSGNTDLQEWNSIINGQSHNVKLYNNRADFC